MLIILIMISIIHMISMCFISICAAAAQVDKKEASDFYLKAAEQKHPQARKS